MIKYSSRVTKSIWKIDEESKIIIEMSWTKMYGLKTSADSLKNLQFMNFVEK